MTKWKIILLLLLLISFTSPVWAQVLVSDPTLLIESITYDEMENGSYNKILDHQTKIQKLQTVTLGLQDELNRVQKKLYSGLQQVSTTIKNAYQIALCAKILAAIYKNEKEMIQTATGHPLAMGWAVKLQKQAIDQAVGVYSDLSSFVLKANDPKLLLSAGDRLQLLDVIEMKLSRIESLSLLSKYEIKRVVSQGIMNAINPFNGIRNHDARIANEIINTWKW